jgi:hypothetical protein
MHTLAQSYDSTYNQYVIQEVEVLGEFRLDTLSPGNTSTLTFETIERQLYPDLAVALQTRPELHIKRYGPGLLATPSFHGTSAAHTEVRWHGLAINSPMNGQLDFSLYPSFMLDQLAVRYNGAGDGIGGTVELQDVLSSENGVHALYQFGSFAQHAQGLSV